MLTWFAIWQGETTATVSASHRERLAAIVRAMPDVRRANFMVPVEVADPHYRDRSGSPSLIVQMDSATIEGLEHALAEQGPLSSLTAPDFLPGQHLSHQAMLVRRYPVATAPQATCVVYWIEYAGGSGDSREWLYRYAQTHPHLVARLPHVRMVELYTPADVICGLAIPVRPCIQRNIAVWDTAADMSEAMASPIRAELREDMATLPPFDGDQLHFPMACETLAV